MLASAGAALASPVRLERSIEAVASAQVVRTTLTPGETAAPVDIEIAFRMRRYAELQSRIAAGETISEAEMQAKYLPLASDYAAALSWARAQGLEIVQTDPSRLAIFARGPVSRLAEVFSVHFARVRGRSGEYTSALDAPTVPDSLSGALLGVNGLQPHLRPRRHSPTARLIPDALNSNYAPYTPAQILSAYGASGSTATGAGQTIAIIDETAPASTDLAAFWTDCRIGQSMSNYSFLQVAPGTPPAASSDAGMEATLDVEWASAMAPGANVRVYETVDSSSVHFDEAYQAIINDAAANSGLRELSISFGSPEITDDSYSQVMTDDQYLARLAAMGVTVFASAGDGGSNPDSNGDYSGSAPAQVCFPASDPNVTAVGGTTLQLSVSNGSVSSETAWSDGGGGTSAYFGRPSWQTGSGVPAGSSRAVPDVASAANPDWGGFVVWNGATYQIGGTSWGAPTWAGYCALLNQIRVAGRLAPLGLLGPHIYPLLGTSSFRDILSGSNGIYSAGPGYDECTGIGVPQLAALMAALSPPVPPTIVAQPVSQAVNLGGSASLSVTASGTAPLAYQWFLDGASIAGATSAAYTVADAQPANAGSYTVIVSNAAGSVTSSAATLTVDAAPAIMTGPQSQTPAAGSTVVLSVAASGPVESYQWQFNGAAVPGATGSTLTLSNIGTTQAGSYTVVVTGPYGSTVSPAATVSVSVEASLVNLSSRAYVAAGSQPMTFGFSIAGGATPKDMLFRGVGPGLAAFGVSDPLAYPELTVYTPTGATLATAGAWGGAPALSTAFSEVGAFPLAATSADSALTESLVPGTYTGMVSGMNASSGVALAEIYDESATPLAEPLVNLSSRAWVGTGSNVLVAGFVISGSTSETILIRGIGPSLAQFGVSGVLAEPALVLYDSSGNVIASNTGWGGDPNLAAAFTLTGAFSLAPTSADSALLVTLPPGGYTAQVSGADGGTGQALVELYAVP